LEDMNERLKIAQFGLGPIGLESLKLASAKPWASIVGGIDNDPAKAGKDLGELTRVESLGGVSVYPTLEELLSRARPDVVLHTTVSKFKEAFAQLEPLARRGISVVSSCEELIFPRLKEPELAARLDAICQEHGSRITGAGVNPGFVMDLLPLCLTAVSREVRSIRIERVVNAATRRAPLQQKIGSGLAPEEFRRLLQAGRAGHAGLRESLALIAHSLGWTLDEITETGDAIVAERPIRTQFFEVKKHMTCGLHQHAEGTVGGRVCIVLDLKMYLDAPNPCDRIHIEGEPPLDVLLQGGVAGDVATVAALVNTARKVMQAPPGLRLITELAMPCWA
jgi:hypothetical protein